MWVRNNKGNVFVGNLPPDFTDERLAETFDPYGIVLSAAVARDPATGARLRYGFVDIASEKAMTKAISALDGCEVDGCKLNVKPRERGVKKPPPPRTQAMRSAPYRAPRDRTEPLRRVPPSVPLGEPSPNRPVQSQSAQSQRALEGLPTVEPPPRRDFEVVRRPLRRSSTPTFQVERRPLPRRV